MSESVIYAGRDLEAMSFAENYHRWILKLFKPYLGKRLVEVGAGTGSFSELLLEQPAEVLTLIEPSAEMHNLLGKRMDAFRTLAPIKTYNATFRRVAEQLEESRPDSIIYINVMEHISDDERELAAIHRTLKPGGRILIFVPALRWLYGNFDRQIGHFRRYTKVELEGKCARAGFNIIYSRYFDVMGILPWWIKYRLLRSSSMGAGAVRLYDRLVVPVAQACESIVRPPIGKNIILVAEKH